MNIAHSTPKYTPGPWRTGDMYHTVFGPPNGQPSPVTIATIAKGNRENARLIKAAPDLAEVLIRFADAMTQRSYPELQGIACDAFAALAKAGVR